MSEFMYFFAENNFKSRNKKDNTVEKEENREYTPEELGELFKWIIVRKIDSPERQRDIDEYVKQRINIDQKNEGRTYGPLEREAEEKYIRAMIEQETRKTPEGMIGKVDKDVADAILGVLIARMEDEKNSKQKTLRLAKETD